MWYQGLKNWSSKDLTMFACRSVIYYYNEQMHV